MELNASQEKSKTIYLTSHRKIYGDIKRYASGTFIKKEVMNHLILNLMKLGRKPNITIRHLLP